MSKVGFFEDKSICTLFAFDDTKTWDEGVFIRGKLLSSI